MPCARGYGCCRAVASCVGVLRLTRRLGGRLACGLSAASARGIGRRRLVPAVEAPDCPQCSHATAASVVQPGLRASLPRQCQHSAC
eukprot:5185009-Pleurochrysis_carterae.AAC.3